MGGRTVEKTSREERAGDVGSFGRTLNVSVEHPEYVSRMLNVSVERLYVRSMSHRGHVGRREVVRGRL